MLNFECYESTMNKMKTLEVDSGSESSDTASNHDNSEEVEVTACPLINSYNIKNKYILHVTATLESNCTVACGLSDFSTEVFSFSNEQFAKVHTLKGHTGPLTGIEFNSDNSNLLFTCSNDGSVKLWDLRTPKTCVVSFADTTEKEQQKSLSCFDIAANNRLLAAGTDLIEGDAFILFWDIRKHTLLGGYWESHTDDITQLKFHTDDSDKLISGSVDGLVNLYNLSHQTEDDALVDSLNTECSVDKLSWLKFNGKDLISCITTTADVQLWRCEDAQPFLHFRRSDIAKTMKRSSSDFTFVVDAYSLQSDVILLTGAKNSSLYGLRLKDKTVQPSLGFSTENQIIRTSHLNANSKLLLTGGEQGILQAWSIR